MATYFEIAREFFRDHDNLLEGMDDHSPDELAAILAKDLALLCHQKFGNNARRGLDEELDPDIASGITPPLVTRAFHKESAKLRLEVIMPPFRAFVEQLKTRAHDGSLGFSDDDIKLAVKRVTRERDRHRSAAQRLDGRIPDLIEELCNTVMTTASVLGGEGGRERTPGGLSKDIEDQIEAAGTDLQGELVAARAGQEDAMRFGAAGVDLTSFELPFKDGSRVHNLLVWEDPDELASHYPQVERSASELDALSIHVAARIHFPFGLTTGERRTDMITAVYLANSATTYPVVSRVVARVEEELHPGGRGGALPAPPGQVVGAIWKHFYDVGHDSGDGVDIDGGGLLRAAAGYATKKGGALDTAWPSGLVGAVMGQRGTPDAAALVENAFPLIEVGKIASWPTAGWEPFGSVVARWLETEQVSNRGGRYPRDESKDGLISGAEAVARLNSQFAGEQFEKLRTDTALKCLLAFRNHLVNTETGNTGSPFTRRTVMDVNKFIVKSAGRSINTHLADVRTESEELTRGIFVQARLASGRSMMGLPEADVVQDGLRRLQLDALEWKSVDTVASDDVDIMSTSDPSRGVTVDSHVVSVAPLGSKKDHELPGWLEAIHSAPVGRRLLELSACRNDEKFQPRSQASQRIFDSGLAGRRLRGAAMRLRSFISYTSYAARSERPLEPSLEAELKVYMDLNDSALPQREQLESEAFMLGICVLFDALPATDSEL